MKQNYKIVFTAFLADYLVECGEKFIHIREDLKYPGKQVFVFKNSKTFEENFKEGIIKQLESQGKEIK